MILEVFAVYDSKVATFGPPFMSNHINEAKRGFREAVNNPQTQLRKYPEDYSLMHLGSFDNQTGKYTNLTAPESLGLAASYLD